MAATMTATSLPHAGPSAYAATSLPNSRNPPTGIARLRSQPSIESAHSGYSRRASVAAIGPPPPIALPDLPSGPPPLRRLPSHTSNSSHPSSPESLRMVSPRRAREGERRPSLAGSFTEDPPESPRQPSVHPYAQSANTSPASRRRSPRTSRASSTTAPHDQSIASSNATQTARTRTKSVLAVALSKANRAVELDEANDVAGAIAAYTESITLLRDIMTRVEQTNAAWRAREAERDRAAARRGDRVESEAEREKRAERLRREEARIAESRRLQTIHDTYQERISMLMAMVNPPTSESDGETSDLPPPPSTSPAHERAASTSSIDSSIARPFTATSSSSRPDTAEDGRTGIGSLMLDHDTSFVSLNSPVEEIQQSTIRPSRMPARPSDVGTALSHGRSASQASTRSLQGPVEIERAREAPSQVPTNAPAPSPASIRVSSPVQRTRIHHANSSSVSTDSSGEFVIPVTATEFGADWPDEVQRELHGAGPRQPTALTGLRARMQQQGHVVHDAAGAVITISEPVPSSETSTPRPLTARPLSNETETTSDSLSLSSFMRVTSTESLTSSGTSSSSLQREAPLPPLPAKAGITMTSPPLGPPAAQPPPTRPTQALPSTRQSRTASLAMQSQPASVAPSSSSGSRLLIHPTTAQGTISQRRRTPTFDQTEEIDQSTLRRNVSATLPAMLASASTSAAIDEFGVNRPPSMALSAAPPSAPLALARRDMAGSATGSLPMRLRTLSQPGKRPGLPSFVTNGYPNMPGDLQSQQVPATISAGSSRKVSAPVFMHQVSPPSLPPTPPSHDNSVAIVSADDSSYTSVETPTSATFARGTGTATTTQSSSSPPLPGDVLPFAPVSPIRKPFQLMRRLRESISSSRGAQISAKLYVPQSVWTQSGIKLTAVETKIRMVELLISGLEGVERAGDMAHFGGPASSAASAGQLTREMDSFDGLLDVIQSTLAKKLGFVDGPKGKKSGPSSLSALSSKLSKSFDRMTNAKSMDPPAVYVEALTRLFTHAQVIDRHLALLHGESAAPGSAAPPSPYDSFHPEARKQVDTRLKRASDFFGTVVCRFVLRDVGMLLDKHVKRGGAWFMES